MIDATTFVTISSWGFHGRDDEVVRQAIDSMGGFSLVLAGRKALLEHDVVLNLAADHHPDACGAVPFATSLVDGRLYAVVNVNTFRTVDRTRFRPAVTNFDGETAPVRLERRARTWIPNVTVSEGEQ